MKAAIKLTQEDASTISILKKEVDKAWKLVEKAKEKEENARKIIQDLKQEIAHLHKIVQSGSGLSFSQDNAMQQVLLEKDQLKERISQKEELINELQQHKINLNDAVLKNEADIQNHKDVTDKLHQEKLVLDETV